MTSRPRVARAGVSTLAALAGLRVALLPVVYAGERLLDSRGLDGRFDAAFALALAYAAIALLASRGQRDRPPGGWAPWIAADLLALVVLAGLSGGADSQFRYVFSVPPMVAAFLGRPRHTVIVIAASTAAYVAAAVLHAVSTGSAQYADTAAQTLFLSWRGAVALLLSIALTRRGDRIAALSASRQQLVARAQEAEEVQRRTLADAIHDEPVQNLLAVRLELDRARRGDAEALERAREIVGQTVEQLRTAIFDLHPPSLGHTGLLAALEQVARRQEQLGGMRVALDVAPSVAAGHDQLLFALGRELLTNAAKHAAASHVSLRVAAEEDAMVLEVADDGRGFGPADRRLAFGGHHIGLASLAERVEATGGTLVVERSSGSGARVRARLPLPAAP